MNWGILLVAGLFEIGWAIGLKYTDGFTRPWPVVWTMLHTTGVFVRRCSAICSFRFSRTPVAPSS